jgi:hypothetical protein
LTSRAMTNPVTSTAPAYLLKARLSLIVPKSAL